MTTIFQSENNATQRRIRRGQTFPEMMIVVAIIAILAAVIMANLFHARGQAQVSAIMETEKSISAALEIYYNDYGVYPAADDSTNMVSPDLFGGPGNKYYNGTLVDRNGDLQYEVDFNPSDWPGPSGWPGGNPQPYAIYPLGTDCLDGAFLQNLKDHANGGATPAPGTVYYLIFAPNFGYFAFAC